MSTEPMTDPPTSGGEQMPPSEPEREGSTWVVLTFDAENCDAAGNAWREREERLTGMSRREAEKAALTIAADGQPACVVPASSWKPVRAERTEIRVVPFDGWAESV